ncbi:ABC transporter substrate-binding protein [Rhizobium brockwellii]|uniref:ABC transporter substrate-binding protein n=1 Tax=Rhizobium brockwellii TaxID=3019932 RepID=UPI003F97133F
MKNPIQTSHSRRQILKGTAMAAVSLAASNVWTRNASADSGSVIVTDGGGTWGAAQKAAYFDPFEKETGIKVVLVPYALAGKIKASVEANAPVADVADLDSSVLPTFSNDGLLEEIDTQYFKAEDLSAFKIAKIEKFGVPSLFGAVVVAFDKSAFPSGGPKTWTEFWDTDKFPGSRSLADGGTLRIAHTFEIALLADGVSPDKLYPIDFDRAFKSLDKIRPQIAKFWTGFAEPVQLIIDQSVSAASAYNGRVTSAQAGGAPLDFSWNQAVCAPDHWVVPKGAKNRDNAMKFIAFASRADRQAEFGKLIDYGPTNSFAYDMLTADRLSRLPTSPGVREKLVFSDFNWWASEASPGVTNEQQATRLWEQWLKKG